MKRAFYNKQKLYTLDITIDELANAERVIPVTNPENARSLKESRTGERREWFGGLVSPKAAEELMATGWAEGAKRVRELQNEIERDIPAAQSRRRKMVWSDDGCDLDIDKGLSGQWDTAYRIAKRKWATGPNVIDINLSWGAPGSYGADDLFWSGAVALVVCDILESAGYSCRINASHINLTGSDRHMNSDSKCWLSVLTICVKDAGEMLRTDALAATLCHAGIFRYLGFNMIASADDEVGCGMGSCRNWHDAIPRLEQAGVWTDKSQVCIEAVFNEGAALKAIKKALAQVQESQEKERAA